MLDANRSAGDVLGEANGALEAMLGQLLAGQRTVDLLRTSPVSSQRQATQDALDRITAARRQLRRTLTEVCLEEGMSSGQIAEIWGVSRQRIDKHVQEIRRSSGA